MKKVMTFFGALIFASVIIASCGGNLIESDAERFADLQCKSQKLLVKATAGDMSVMAEITKLSNEAATLSKELDGKYTTDSDKQKLAEVISKAMGDCK